MNWYFRVLKKYATFEGRARRKEYWYFKLFHNLIIYAFILYGIYSVLSDPWLDKNADFITILPRIFNPLLVLYLVVTFVPNLAVSVRRLHDINRNSEYLLLWLIPPVGPLVLFVFFAMPGHSGANKFGSDPITDPDAPPMEAAQRRRERIAYSQRQATHTPNRPKKRRPQESARPPKQLPYKKRDVHDEHMQAQDYASPPPNEFESERSRPRKQSLMYGLDRPMSNEGNRYLDPFAEKLSSQESDVDAHLQRFGVIVDEPTQKEENFLQEPDFDKNEDQIKNNTFKYLE